MLEALPPYRGGGDMIERVSFSGTTYNTIPYKFEAGTPNIAGVIGMGAAIEYVFDLGMETIVGHKKELTDHLTEGLHTIPGLTIYGQSPTKTSIASFAIEGVHPHDLSTLLDQHGVAIRTGHHCTQPLMDRYGITATSRASLTVYNTHDEIDRFIGALSSSIKFFQGHS
jgi:cysteine desulfurase/selenocysteine lyase